MESPVSEPPAPSGVDFADLRARAARVAAAGTTEQKLVTAWFGPVRRRAMRLRNLWRNFKLARRYRLRRLSPSSVRVTVPAGQVPDCKNCRDTCCKGPNLVSLRLGDIARLHDAGLGWAIDTDPVARARDYRDELTEQLGRDAFTRFPVLEHTAEGNCVFLQPDGRCAIYPIRPLTCQRFPFMLEEGGTIAYSSACQYPRRDGSEAERDTHVKAVVDTYNEKLRDLVLLEHGLEELAQLDLAQYLPGSRSFADVLAATRQG